MKSYIFIFKKIFIIVCSLFCYKNAFTYQNEKELLKIQEQYIIMLYI